MEKLCLSSTQSPKFSNPFLPSIFSVNRASKRVIFPIKNPKKFTVFASKDDQSFDFDSNNNNSKFNEWDLMELKFGKMLGEDPKLTLAKVMGRKLNPDASYIEIEKNFHKNKGKIVEVKELPFDVPEKLGAKKVSNGLNLVKPVPNKGIKLGGGGGGGPDSSLPQIKRPSGSVNTKSADSKSNVQNVILRKPSVFNEGDDDMDSPYKMRIKRNLSLSMSTEKEKFSGMTLLKKPQPSVAKEESTVGNENISSKGSMYDFEGDEENDDQITGEVPLLDKPIAFPQTGMQQPEQTEGEYSEKEIGTSNTSNEELTTSDSAFGSVLLGRPKRLDQPRKAIPYPTQEGTTFTYPESSSGDVGSLSRSLEGPEEGDWTRIEQLSSLGDRVDVELISCSPRGFVASYGSLIGFLPYRNLAAKWKFLAFESWLRKNDLDPSKYRQSLGIIGGDEGRNLSMPLESSPAAVDGSQKAEFRVTADMELDELLRIYDQAKIQYLSSFVGQRIKVNILYADKKSRKLIFSMRPKENEEIVEKKRNLMKKLTVGDVVKCCVKKITYFGIFVEVEGVPALVHQTEVSWDYTLDPTAYLKIGEIVEAKVHQLDFALERIFLSLKEITPDPLNEALECIVGNNSFNGELEAAQADSEWAEVDSLIKELQEVDGVQAVSKGRFFLSPGLAPTFQVYMASMFENQYKLLARSGNKVQEVIVKASLGKEEMKSEILKCTNRVEL